MKKTKLILFACITAAVVTIVGCVAPNPHYQPPPADQNPITNPQFIPDTGSISNAGATAHALNNAVPHPYQVPVDGLIEGGLLLATGISGLYAKIKSNQAAKHQSALNTMALGIVKAGPEAVKTVTDTAAATPDLAHVVTTINEHTA